MPGRPIVLACAAAALLAAAPAPAQSNSDPDAQWGAHGGVVTGPDSGGAHPSFGLHWRPRLTGALGLEVSAGYERLRWSGASGTVDADHVPVEGSLLFFFFSTHRVQPYLLGGIGYHWVNPYVANPPAGTTYPSQNLFALHAGAGIDVRAGEKLSFWVDGRWTFLDVAAVKDLGLTSGTLRVTAGVNVAF
jgi:opacity protein-like surface antigen